MPKVHIARNGQQIGQFTEQEIANGLASGQFLVTDLYWHEGMSSWEKLSRFDSRARETLQIETNISAENSYREIDANGIAWETKGRNFLVRWWDTTINCLFNPNSTFKTMPVQGGMSAPLTFYFFSVLVIGVVMSFAQALSQAVVQSNQNGESPSLAVSLFCGTPFIILLAGFFGIFMAFFCSAISHFLLGILGAANKGFEATFRAVCYSLGSANSLQIIPLIGFIAAFFWAPVIFVISLKEAHKTDYWRVILAFTLAVVVPCGAIICLGLLVAMFSGYRVIPQ